MFNIDKSIVLTKQYILSKVSQEEIFEKYLKRPVVLNRSFRSTIRKDKKPTCRFKYYGDVLIYKDFSGHFTGDCFKLVKFLHPNCTQFKEALEIIANDFKIYNSPEKYKVKLPVYQNGVKENGITKIRIKKRSWNKVDVAYWMQYGINTKILNFFQVYPLQKLWYGDKLLYYCSKNDPGYAYRFKKYVYKAYFPLRKHKPNNKKPRFYSNKSVVQGLDQLPKEGGTLIITKSLKDVMLLRTYGIFAIAPPSEEVLIKEDLMNELQFRFSKIYTLYDFDYSGVRGANKMRKTYGTEPIFLTNGRFGTKDYKAKDITDLFKLDKDEFNNVIKQLS